MFATNTLLALSSDAFLEDVFCLTNSVLLQEPFVGEFAKGFQKGRGRTNDEMAEELAFICIVSSNSDDEIMRVVRKFAFECFPYFPSTNTAPFLIQVFQEEDNQYGSTALDSYLRLQGFSQEGLAVVDAFFDKNPRSGHRISAFSRLSHELKYEKHSAETRERMLDFILQRAERGDIYGTWLDDILCQHLECYAASDERRRNLKLLLGNPMALESTIERAKARLADMDRQQEKRQSNISGEMPLQEEQKTIEDAASPSSAEPSITQKPISENAIDNLPSRQPRIMTAIIGLITIVLAFCILVFLFFHRK